MKISARNKENETIARAKQGDQTAMRELYRDYSAMVLNTSFRILNHRAEAEDVLQETFIKVLGCLDQFEQRASFGSYVKRIAINKSIDILKKKKINFLTSDEEISDQACEEMSIEAESNRDLEQIYQAIHQLPEGYRTIFSLKVLEGYDHKEIAQILGINVSTSISQLSRAKSKIRKIIALNPIL